MGTVMVTGTVSERVNGPSKKIHGKKKTDVPRVKMYKCTIYDEMKGSIKPQTTKHVLNGR